MSLQITGEETEAQAGSGASATRRTCPQEMPRSRHLPTDSSSNWAHLHLSPASHAGWLLKDSGGHSATFTPRALRAPLLCWETGRGRDGWAQGSSKYHPSHRSGAREMADFPIFSFQLLLGILNFALQSEGSKEWLPWQPFPCFCHQGTQHSV